MKLKNIREGGGLKILSVTIAALFAVTAFAVVFTTADTNNENDSDEILGDVGPPPVLSTRGTHNLAIRSDGTVWAWGDNAYGRLGDGTTIHRNAPVQVKDGTGFLTNVKAISASGSHSLALKNDGTVLAWGINGYGQLGDGTTTDRNTPVQVKDPADSTGFLTGVTAISAGSSYSLVLKSDGTVWAWGYGDSGQLGDGTPDGTASRRSTPAQVVGEGGVGFLTGVTAISAGSVSLALKNDGTVWAWGRGEYGQVGDGDSLHRRTPVQVHGPGNTGFLTGVTAISASSYNSIALKNDGTVWAWGHNAWGQLGDGTTANSNKPVQVKDSAGTGFLTDVTAISAGSTHSLAVKSDKTAWAWGLNNWGQIGDGTNTNRIIPVLVLGPPKITTVSLTGGNMGATYGQTLTATGGGITWAIDSGSLPAGLSMSPAGVISGTPTAAGTFNFTVKAANVDGQDTRSLSIVIASAGGGGGTGAPDGGGDGGGGGTGVVLVVAVVAVLAVAGVGAYFFILKK